MVEKMIGARKRWAILPFAVGYCTCYVLGNLRGGLNPGQQLEDDRPSFTKILKESKSDKHWRHHYERYYDKWLAPYRDVPDLAMVEIGADSGASLKAWARYFTDPRLILGLAYGVSLENLQSVKSDLPHKDRIKILQGDQGSNETLSELCRHGPYHVIIDDGSHYPPHMVLGFASLFSECLLPGGLYVVEDLETNYWKAGGREIYGYKLDGGIGTKTTPAISAVEKFKQLVDVLMWYQLKAVDALHVLPGDEHVCSIEWGMNLVAFRRCTEDEARDHPVDGPFGEVVDKKAMEEYVREAKGSNPKGFRGRRRLREA
ncbi:hypothetical protein ACHAWF_002341 [Thalassiosira exigua]